MKINKLLKEKKMSMYELSKWSEVPYSTVSDICKGKTRIEKCSAETVYKIAHVLGTTVDDLVRPYIEKRPYFENFKSAICHRVKEMGDIDFIVHTLESNMILEYYEREWYPESFYLLAMTDYLSKIHNVPLCTEYDELRTQKLERPVFPAGILARCLASGTDAPKKKALKDCIPEFKKYNIIESEIRNVI